MNYSIILLVSHNLIDFPLTPYNCGQYVAWNIANTAGPGATLHTMKHWHYYELDYKKKAHDSASINLLDR